MYVIKRAKELGYITVVVDKDEKSIGFQYADFYRVIDIVNKEKCLQYAIEMKIDGVLTAATDYGVLTASYIANKLNLNGLPYEVAQLVKNKYEVRKKLVEEKVDDTPQFFSITSLDEINDIENKIIFPIMIKPCDGSGSKGVNRANNIIELKTYCQEALKYSLSKKVLLETFIVGKEYGVESFVYRDNVHVLGVMEKEMTKSPYYAELGHTISYKIDNELEEKIKSVAEKAIRTLSINFGSVNMDVLVTEDNKVCIVDIGARMGGNLIGSHIIPIATGIDYMGNMIKGALNEDVNFELKGKNVVATRIMNFDSGIVESLPSLLEYQTDVDVKDIVCKLKIGDSINTYKNNLDGCGYVVVSCENIIIAEEKANKIKDDINLKIKRTKEE